jgi:hypothetical protein
MYDIYVLNTVFKHKTFYTNVLERWYKDPQLFLTVTN